MTTYTNKQTVDPGLYFTLTPLTLTSMDTRGQLPGADDLAYHKVPMLMMLAMAPLAGLAFVIFLPFIGFAMVLRMLGEKVADVVATLATQSVRVVRPAWAPALAFLTRSKPAAPTTTAPPVDEWADEKEQQLDATDADHR